MNKELISVTRPVVNPATQKKNVDKQRKVKSHDNFAVYRSVLQHSQVFWMPIQHNVTAEGKKI